MKEREWKLEQRTWGQGTFFGCSGIVLTFGKWGVVGCTGKYRIVSPDGWELDNQSFETEREACAYVEGRSGVELRKAVFKNETNQSSKWAANAAEEIVNKIYDGIGYAASDDLEASFARIIANHATSGFMEYELAEALRSVIKQYAPLSVRIPEEATLEKFDNRKI